MGCIGSKADINDRHPNIFQVTNINDQGRKIKSGKLQVTDTDLIFYQRGRKPTKWPLRSLRKYGFDTEIFSFECGRRCPTGHGIYAFKCKKAELMFNVVQQHITGSITEDANVNHGDFHTAIGPVMVPGRLNSNSVIQFPIEGYLNPIAVPPISRAANDTSRPGTIFSNGSLSPTMTSPPVTEFSEEHNNNKRTSLTPEPTYTNSVVLENNEMKLSQYTNLGNNDEVGDVLSCSHVYMNVDVPQSLIRDGDENHCYANIHTEDLETLISSDTVPTTTLISYANLDQPNIEEVNYAELDLNELEQVSEQKVIQGASTNPTVKEKYVTIDFQKTTALSQSKNPNMAIEEGSRKTRHNSTINYNNSISD